MDLRLLNQSPTSSISSTGGGRSSSMNGYSVTMSPSSSNSSISSRSGMTTSYTLGAITPNSPPGKQAHGHARSDSNVTINYSHYQPHHHSAHHSKGDSLQASPFGPLNSLNSVDLMKENEIPAGTGGALGNHVTFDNTKDIQYKSVAFPPITPPMDQTAVRQTAAHHSRQPTSSSSYATQAYREFMNNNGSGGSSGVNSNATSVVSSAASSAAPSRQSSRPSSRAGYASTSVSGQSSRANSPSLSQEGEDREPGEIVQDTGTAIHKHTTSAVTAGPYLDNLQFPSLTSTTTTLTQQVSTLSFQGMKKSDSQGSLDESSRTQQSYRTTTNRPNPNHFTFCQDDIMQSFLRAAERDRQKQEKELQREREALQRREMELDYERRKQAAKEMLALEKSYAKKHYRIGTVGEDYADDSSDEDDVPFHSRKFPPVPHHFKFSTHDITKSQAKPVQRQNIGHWTTFPKSSTVVITGVQLKSWIAKMIQQQNIEREEKRLQLALAEKHHSHHHHHAQEGRKQSSAPNSPMMHQQSQPRTEQTIGSATTRMTSSNLPRRLSVPVAVVADEKQPQSHIPIRIASRPTHSRSHSHNLVNFTHNKVHTLPEEAAEKVRLTNEKDTDIRRTTGSSGSASRIPTVASNEALAQVASRRSTMPLVKGVVLPHDAVRRVQSAQMGSGGHRRNEPILGQPSSLQSLTPPLSGASSVMSQSPLLNVRRTVTPSPQTQTQPGYGQQQRLAHAGLSGGLTPQPPARTLVNGRKSASANSSPNPPVADHGSSSPSWTSVNASLLTKSYEKSSQNELAASNPNSKLNMTATSAYKDVPSSGYGQQQQRALMSHRWV